MEQLIKHLINLFMNTIEIMLVGLGLAMDAFAVSICKGLSMKKINWKIQAGKFQQKKIR